MSYKAIVYKVMIASPSDLVHERNIICEVLSEWNIVNADTRKMVLLPVKWETHASPTMGDHPQSIINKQILKNSDLLVGVFWTRIGTATGEYLSGTVEEIEEHIKAGKPVMLYFSSQPVPPDSVDNDQYAELKKFKESCKSRGIFETYSNLDDFKSKFYRQLQLKLNQDSYFLKDIANQDTSILQIKVGPDILKSYDPSGILPHLSLEAQELLKEASYDPNGIVLRSQVIGGLYIQTNGKEFVRDNNPRTRAIWEGALEELEANGLLSDAGNERQVFKLTRRGYEIAEKINP
jgi:hypothetical protein